MLLLFVVVLLLCCHCCCYCCWFWADATPSFDTARMESRYDYRHRAAYGHRFNLLLFSSLSLFFFFILFSFVLIPLLVFFILLSFSLAHGITEIIIRRPCLLVSSVANSHTLILLFSILKFIGICDLDVNNWSGELPPAKKLFFSCSCCWLLLVVVVDVGYCWCCCFCC